jgi:hypothetical protein
VLGRRHAIDILLYLNGVREAPALAHAPDYRTRFNGYYIPAPHNAVFYDALYGILYRLAAGELQPDLSILLQEMYAATEQRHLSFCSKLMVTIEDDAVVFDKNVAFFLASISLHCHRRIGSILRCNVIPQYTMASPPL